MRLIKPALALVCALTMTCSIFVSAETSKSRDYEVIEVEGDDGKTVTVEEREPESEADFDPEGTIVKDVIFDYPDTEEGEVVAEISIPEDTTNISAYVENDGWHKVKVIVKKSKIYVPITNHHRIIIVVEPNGKSPKTGEPEDHTLLMDSLLIGAATVGAVVCYRKKEEY